MLVAKKKVLENLEDGYGKDGDDDEKEDSGDDGFHLGFQHKEEPGWRH